MTKDAPVGQSFDSWPLHDAKTHFSELVRAAESRGPQCITVRGREAVVVVAVDEFRRLVPARNGRALVEAMLACPVSDFAFGSPPVFSKVRDFDL